MNVTITTIKLFLVLCCQTESKGYTYEVKDISVPHEKIVTGGTLYTDAKYNEGDTIQLAIPKPSTLTNKQTTSND
jgi:hypothetical protein